MRDIELLASFQKERSDDAFAALVKRHASLVYSTALRQLGDPTMAQETAQEVFLTLARKAPRLNCNATLAGWLYQSTLLEARQRIRRELRRKRREQTAIELNTTMAEETSMWRSLVPLLDEALMQLREQDRLAVLLRYFEEKDLRTIGESLQISEDAAQKRVRKSLNQLIAFFRKRGFSISTVAGMATLFREATYAVPPTFIPVVSQLAIDQAAPSLSSGLTLLFGNLMSLTKTQTLSVCALMSLAPMIWQWHGIVQLRNANATLSDQLASLQTAVEATEKEQSELLRRWNEMEGKATEASSFKTISATVGSSQLREEKPYYDWDDRSPYVRIPKRLIPKLGIQAIEGRPLDDLRLSSTISDALEMTDDEVAQSNQALSDFAAQYRWLETYNQQPTDRHVDHPMVAIQKHSFLQPSLAGSIEGMQQQLKENLQQHLGPERAELLWKPLEHDARWLLSNIAGHEKIVTIIQQDRTDEPYRVYEQFQNQGNTVFTLSYPIPTNSIPIRFKTVIDQWAALKR